MNASEAIEQTVPSSSLPPEPEPDGPGSAEAGDVAQKKRRYARDKRLLPATGTGVTAIGRSAGG